MAVKFKEQSPVMGTLDPYSLDRNYLMGIVEYSDPIDPIEQSNSAELFDRSKMDTIAKTAEVIKTNVGRLYASDKPNPLPSDFLSQK